MNKQYKILQSRTTKPPKDEIEIWSLNLTTQSLLSAVDNLRSDLLFNLSYINPSDENQGTIGNMQGAIDVCNQILQLEIFDNLESDNEQKENTLA